MEHKFYDCFGQELEPETCEYCGETKPIKHWSSIEDGRDVFTVLMVEYTKPHGRKVWTCKECAADINNRLEGKET